MSTPQELEAKFWKALKSDMTVMLGVDGVEDRHARPMTAQVEHEHSPIWFFTARDTELVKNLRNGAHADATFASKGHNLFATIHGHIAMDNDRATIERLWNPFVAAWFKGGKDDPNLGAAAVRCRARGNLARRIQPDRRCEDAARRRPEEGLSGQGCRGEFEIAPAVHC